MRQHLLNFNLLADFRESHAFVAIVRPSVQPGATKKRQILQTQRADRKYPLYIEVCSDNICWPFGTATPTTTPAEMAKESTAKSRNLAFLPAALSGLAVTFPTIRICGRLW